MSNEPEVVTITTYDEARDAYRQKELRQALYDAGEVIMADVLVNLHGAQHRDRRRLENRLFRRETYDRYENELFPPIIAATFAPYAVAGRAELVSLGHQLMMNLAAFTAGIDRPLGTPDETFRLYDYLKVFVVGATLAHYTGDRKEKAAEVAEALHRFDEEFLTPSISRRREAIAAGGDIPLDVLSILVRNQDDLHLPHDTLLREVAFYLLAGAHTSAIAFTRVSHNIFKWLEAHPEDDQVVRTDRTFVQRCTHETVRLQPSSPVGMRWALEDLVLRSGRPIPKGAKVVIDLVAVNRDRAAFGDDADEFDPRRTLVEGVAPYGLSFGSGMHACIGQDLAAGVPAGPDGPAEDHLVGLVPEAVQTLFRHGARPDPDDPPQMDESTTRPYFGRYPVVLRTS